MNINDPSSLRRVVARLFVRHERRIPLLASAKAGAGVALAVAMIATLSHVTGFPLLMAPLGATAALLFGQPSSPLAQPANVFGGYFIAVLCCEMAFQVFSGFWLAAAIAVGFSLTLMRTLRVTHPPACAMPILAFGGVVHGGMLFAVTLVSCVLITALALVVHRIPPRRTYPR